MNSSFLYHAWGQYDHKCTSKEYKGNTIILHVEAKERQRACPDCGCRHLVKEWLSHSWVCRSSHWRKVQRYKCKSKGCGYDRQENIPFATGSCGYTHRFAKYVVGLLKAESKVPQLMKMAATIMAHRTGILAWYDCHISTGKVEGINNKIKVMKRTSYGFRDERYFELRLYALHDCRITRNVGWAVILFLICCTTAFSIDFVYKLWSEW